jgi:hypothetical protein
VVRVSFTYEPDPEETDDDHAMGITGEEYDRLVEELMALGYEDVQVEKVG